MLGSLWGRAVAGDEKVLAEAAGAAANADWLADQVAVWLGDAVAEAGALPEPETQAAIRAVWTDPEARAAVGDLVGQAVAAGLAPPGAEVVIDPAAAILPVVEEIASSLAAAGVQATPAEVRSYVEQIEPVVAVAAPGAGAGSLRRVRSVLTTALAVAAAVMAVAAASALAIADDRWAIVRSLALRATLTALGFAVMLRVGAWALDPSGGAAPLRQGGAILLGSQLGVLWWFAAVAAVPAVAAARTRRLRAAPAAQLVSGSWPPPARARRRARPPTGPRSSA